MRLIEQIFIVHLKYHTLYTDNTLISGTSWVTLLVKCGIDYTSYGVRYIYNVCDYHYLF